MRICISNLAWSRADDEAVSEVMRSHSVTHVELAPTKVWPEPVGVTEAEAKEYRAVWTERGIEVAALQSLLFGKPHLSIFGSPEAVGETEEYLVRILHLGSWLGAKRLVFGSPKNRIRGELSLAEALSGAARFFRSVGKEAARLGICLCLEPNPREYGADFITTASEGAELVTAIGHPGVGLHLDTACMTLAGDQPDEVLLTHSHLLRHFHISEPRLAPLGAGGVDHTRFAAALRQTGFQGLLSIEMLPPADVEGAAAIDAALSLATRTYLRTSSHGENRQ